MNNIGDKSDKSQSSYSLFISDLHLCASRPRITATFLDFLANTASKANGLYILGDLFEYWAGDDDIQDIHHQPIISAFKLLSEAGVKLYFIHGNRDFLISSEFCQASGISLLQDPSLITLYGKSVLLSHGDGLCTDDVEYQKFRLQVRNAKWQHDFLNLPLQIRKEQIDTIRAQSKYEKSLKSMQIMDANQEAIHRLLKDQHYPDLLIHGHTHRPAEHQIQLDGHHITRWVLGDWYEQGSYLRFDQFGCKAMQLDGLSP